jgi:protein-disulfide isomerase
MARHLGINGTPSWIAGGKLLGGAVGYDALANAIAAPIRRRNGA